MVHAEWLTTTCCVSTGRATTRSCGCGLHSEHFWTPSKKQLLVGNYANGGVEYEPADQPVQVNAHNFPGPGLA
jgi:hypothetical protein